MTDRLNDEELKEVEGGFEYKGHTIQYYPVDQYEIKENTRYFMRYDDYRTFATVLKVYEESWGCGTRRCADYIDENSNTKNSCYIDSWSSYKFYMILS